MSLLSIVMPTKNRHIYCFSSIKYILENFDDRFELIIVDNSDEDVLQIWIEKYKFDSRLVYYRVKEYVSVIENFQLGVDLARYEYVCLIGDDDGINKEVIDLVYWASKKNVNAITPKFLTHFTWPDLNNLKLGNFTKEGVLIIKHFNNNIELKYTNKGLNTLNNSCGLDFADTYYIPKLYYGIIKNSILKKIREEYRTNFPGVSPDISAAVSSCFLIDEFIVLDYPIFLPGSSAKSTAGQSNIKQHIGELSAQKHISKKDLDNWPEEIPFLFSVETVWGQSAYVSLLHFDLSNNKKFNFHRIYARIFTNHKKFRKDIFRNYYLNYRKNIFLFISRLIFFIIEIILYLFVRIKYKINSIFNFLISGVVEIKCLDIYNANVELENYLKSKNINLSQILDLAELKEKK